MINITEFHSYAIQHNFTGEKDIGTTFDLNNMSDTKNNVWDFSQVSTVQVGGPNGFPTTGFAINSDGIITNRGDAFLNVNDIVMMVVTGINGSTGMLTLQDVS
jgi:hypothetical protein